MALREIIDITASELGLDSTSDRSLLLRLINRAAKEIYDFEDLPGSLRETVLNVPTSKQISLPDFIGTLRAMREYQYGRKVELNDMAPRYSYEPWPSYWRRWRLKNDCAITTDIVNAGPLFFQSLIDTPAAVVSVCGRATDAWRMNEDKTLDTTTKQTTYSYTQIFSLQRHARGRYDITVLNMNGVEIARIRNSRLSTKYRLCDLNEYPFYNIVSDSYYIEVLYKEELDPFYYDSDVFPAGDDYDMGIAVKACEVHYRPQDGKEKKIKSYFDQAQHIINMAAYNISGPVQKQISFAPDPLKDLVRRDYYPMEPQ